MKDLFISHALPARGLGDLIVEKWDRALEVASRHILAKSMWSEMKENVAYSISSGRGIQLMADEIAELDKLSNGKLEIHLIGHSAGSFVSGSLLKKLHDDHNLTVNTCTLYAPACDVKFALEHFKEAIDNKQLARKEFRIHVLSEELELDDSVGPYRKSLLYLVCRALERWHKTPILGLANVFDKKQANEQYWHTHTVNHVKGWQKFFWNKKAPGGFAETGQPSPGGNLLVLSDKQVNTGPQKIKSSHGCFDNSIEIVSNTLEIIRGSKLKNKIKDLSY